jgi:predicted acylesterase/phospholipase RssA
VFGELDTASLHALQRQMEWQHHSNGSVIFRQGDEADGMYIIINGRLRVVVTSPDGEDRVISEVGPGETVGEYAVLTEDIRSATVHAVRETNLAKISQPVFRNLVREYPELLGKIARIIVERQQRTLALAQFGTTVVLSDQEFDERYGKEGVSKTAFDDAVNPAIVAWMDDLEANNDFVIYVGGCEHAIWEKRCIGQADRVLIIADPTGDPAPSAVEQLLGQLEVPLGTSAWLDQRQVHTHHHVRRGDRQHMGRLARRLSGHAVALVLSGGGARGFAQLGVYRAMLELGIPVDYVGGSSFGGLMAGLIARNLSYDELMGLADKFASSRRIFDYTLPFTALLTSKKVTQICQEVFGDLLIEDLWFPFFCVSSNLSRAEPVVHQRGAVWRAVRASLAIPGVFAPVIEDDEVLVDGGVMDNFPIELMVKLSESDRVIGVHASPHQESARQWDYDTSISGWRILYYKVNPFVRPLRSPSLMGTILRAQEVNSAYQAKSTQSLVDLLLRLDMREFGFLDFDDYKAIAEAGYAAAFDALREWMESRGISQ